MKNDFKKIKILGIEFFNDLTKDAVNLIKSGGLLVAPSGPGLATIDQDRPYYQSLLQADLVIADSGFMVLLWNLFHKNRVNRISGLEFLNTFLSDEEIINSTSLILVDPRPDESIANSNYLRTRGFKIDELNSYIAPIYERGKVEDKSLLALIEKRKPKYVLINLGGGTQEILGAYLKKNLSYRPGLICTGAAIAFLTGKQVSIPTWADKLFLGWLFRIFANPGLYIIRYLMAFKLAIIMLLFKENQFSN